MPLLGPRLQETMRQNQVTEEKPREGMFWELLDDFKVLAGKEGKWTGEKGSDVETLTPHYQKLRWTMARVMRSVAGESVANHLFSEKYMKTVPHREVPFAYEGVRKVNGRWINPHGEELEEPPHEFDRSSEDMQRFMNKLTRYNWPMQVPKELASVVGKAAVEDSAKLRMSVKGLLSSNSASEAAKNFQHLFELVVVKPELVDMSEEGWTRPAISLTPGLAAYWGPAAAKMGGEIFRAIGGLIKAGVTPPRLALKALSKMYPDQQWINPALTWTWENIIIPSKIPEAWRGRYVPNLAMRKSGSGKVLFADEGKHSLAEIFQPAVERWSKKRQYLHRDTYAQKAKVTDIGKDTSKLLAKETTNPIIERHKLGKELRGISTPYTPTSSKYYDRLAPQMRGMGVKGAYQKYFFDDLEKAYMKTLKSSGKYSVAESDYYASEEAVKYIKQWDHILKGKKPKEAQKFLKGMMDDLNLPLNMRHVAEELYNLPFNTPMAVGDAGRYAAKKYLVAGLKNQGATRAFVSDTLLKSGEWLESQFPGLRGLYVPRDIELELRTLELIPKISRGMFNEFFLTPWKTMKVVLRPATWMRNTLSNMILNDWGGLPFYRLDMYYRGGREMVEKGRYWQEWKKLTGGGGTFTLTDIEQSIQGMRFPSTKVGKILSTFNNISAPARGFYNAQEQVAKMAKFIWNREKGMDMRQAADDAMKWTFNYGEITRAIGYTRQSIAPFATWQSKVLPLMAETAAKHPLRFAKWPLMLWGMHDYAIQKAGLNEDEWQYIKGILPEYIKDGKFMLMPWRDNQDRLQLLNLTYMLPGLGDVAEISQNPLGVLLGHPLAGMASALLTKTKFGGAPLYYDWEDPHTKFSKTMGYMYRSFFPSFMPGVPGLTGPLDTRTILTEGGTDWSMLWNSFLETPGAAEPSEALMSASGFKMYPVDKMKEARRTHALEQIHRAEIGSRLRTEMRKEKSPERRRELIQKYSKYMMKLGQPLD